MPSILFENAVDHVYFEGFQGYDALADSQIILSVKIGYREREQAPSTSHTLMCIGIT